MTRPTARPGGALTLNAPRHEDELKLNLGDLPPAHDSLEVEGFKPSLLSRLLNLIAPLHR